MENTPHRGFASMVLTGFVGGILGAAVMYILVAPRATPSVSTAPPMPGGRPAVAPVAQLPPAEGGIVQRRDGMVFIHSGAGSVQVMPAPSGGWTFSFGYRPQAGGPVDAAQWQTLINLRQDRQLQQQLNLTAGQLKNLGGSVPCPAEERAAIQKLFEAYVAAPPGSAQDRAKTALLNRVRQTGEAQGPLVTKWLDERLATLSAEQRAKLYPQVER